MHLLSDTHTFTTAKTFPAYSLLHQWPNTQILLPLLRAVVLPYQDTQASGKGGIPALCAMCPDGSGTGLDPLGFIQASREHSWDKGALKSRQDLSWAQSSSNTAYPAGFSTKSYRAPCQGQNHKDTMKIPMEKYEALWHDIYTPSSTLEPTSNVNKQDNLPQRPELLSRRQRSVQLLLYLWKIATEFCLTH